MAHNDLLRQRHAEVFAAEYGADTMLDDYVVTANVLLPGETDLVNVCITSPGMPSATAFGMLAWNAAGYTPQPNWMIDHGED